MKKFLKTFALCAIALTVVLTLTACGGSQIKAYDEMKTSIESAGYTVTELSTTETYGVAVVSGLIAEKASEKTIIVLFARTIETPDMELYYNIRDYFVETYGITNNFSGQDKGFFILSNTTESPAINAFNKHKK